MYESCKPVSPESNSEGIHYIGYWLLAIGYWLLAIGYWLLAIGSGCTNETPDTDSPSPYQSVWAELSPATLTRPRTAGTLLGDFHTAADAREQNRAHDLWADFLARHDPADGYFEDAMQARLVEWTRMEVVRLNYLRAGDSAAVARQVEKMQSFALE